MCQFDFMNSSLAYASMRIPPPLKTSFWLARFICSCHLIDNSSIFVLPKLLWRMPSHSPNDDRGVCHPINGKFYMISYDINFCFYWTRWPNYDMCKSFWPVVAWCAVRYCWWFVGQFMGILLFFVGSSPVFMVILIRVPSWFFWVFAFVCYTTTRLPTLKAWI